MILTRQSGLGRGLGALIPSNAPQQKTMSPAPAPAPSQPTRPTAPAPSVPASFPVPPPAEARILDLPIEVISRNPHQPRSHFDHAQLEDLIASIKEYGVLQPLIATRLSNGRYELIAGERRLRAATIAGLKLVPVIIRSATEQEKLELALIENIQRQDLNPVEEALAYTRLTDEFSLTQDEVARRVGKSRSQVANTVRLLQLPEEIRQAIVEGKISASNARTLLAMPNEAERDELFKAMLANRYTVRETEAKIARMHGARPVDPNLAEIATQLRTALHCRVQVRRDAKGKGEIRLKFTSDEEMKALIEQLQS